MRVLVLLMAEKTRNDRDGKVSNGIISEYVSPMGKVKQ